MWLAKQGVPKNMKNILKQKLFLKRAVGGRVVKQTKTKNIFNQEEKFSGLKTKKSEIIFLKYT